MKASDEILTRITDVLVQALGVDEGDVVPSATLLGDLGAESIDFLDIVFRLEREFGIKIPRGELFAEAAFRDDAGLDEGGRMTDEGVAMLRSQMPYADLSCLERGRRMGKVTDLFTVDLLVRYVDWKLKGRSEGGPVFPMDVQISQTTITA
jgi:acyl carrier protein